MTLDDLTVNFRHLDRDRLLSDWRWLIGPARLPILLTASGDAFVQDPNDGSIHILDVATAELKRVANTLEEFQSLLGNRDFVVDHFAVAMVSDLKRSGLNLGPGQIYSYKTPPVLGGEFTLDNIEVADIEVHFSIAGQIHERVRNLPPGTRIKGLSIK